MNSLVTKLKKRLLPEFKEIADRINKTTLNVQARACSYDVGAATQYQGYSFCIDCLFTTDYEDTDNVALTVNLGYLMTVPRICAGISWGHPSGHSEAEFKNWSGMFPDEGIKVSEKILEDLYEDLPRLYEVLFEALERRKPSNE